MDSRTCPWCAEPVSREARRCPHCASAIGGGVRDPHEWHRDYAERKLGGVSCALAENLGISVSLVRAGFLLLAFFHAIGIVLYAALWFVIPPAPGSRSGFERALDILRGLFDDAPPTPRRRRRRDQGDPDEWSPTRS